MDAYLTLLMEEYRSLQAGALQAGRNTYLSLQWASATMAVLVAAAVSQWRQHDAAVEIVFFLAVPFFSSMAMLFFIGELARIRRVADYLCALEAKARLLVSTQPDERGDLGGLFQAELSALQETHGITYPVPLGMSPLGWERWLVDLRNRRAGATFGHLSWVYRTRLGLFPVVTLSSLAVATYYTFGPAAIGTHRTEDWAMLIVGFAFSFVMTWFAIELAVELARVTPLADKRPSLIRRGFRLVMGAIFQIGDWRHPEAIPDAPNAASAAGTAGGS